MAPVSGPPASARRSSTRGTPVVVIGQDVADHFFPGARSGRARAARSGGIPYTVVGVDEKQGSAFGISFDKFIIAPHKLADQPAASTRTA